MNWYRTAASNPNYRVMPRVRSRDYIRYHLMLLQDRHLTDERPIVEELLDKMINDITPTVQWIIDNSHVRHYPAQGAWCPKCRPNPAGERKDGDFEGLMDFADERTDPEEAGLDPADHQRRMESDNCGYFNCPSCGHKMGWNEYMESTSDERGKWRYTDADVFLEQALAGMKSPDFDLRHGWFEATIEFAHGSGDNANWFIEGGSQTVDYVRQKLGDRGARHQIGRDENYRDQRNKGKF
jgi:hypothetical protein